MWNDIWFGMPSSYQTNEEKGTVIVTNDKITAATSLLKLFSIWRSPFVIGHTIVLASGHPNDTSHYITFKRNDTKEQKRVFFCQIRECAPFSQFDILIDLFSSPEWIVVCSIRIFCAHQISVDRCLNWIETWACLKIRFLRSSTKMKTLWIKWENRFLLNYKNVVTIKHFLDL